MTAGKKNPEATNSERPHRSREDVIVRNPSFVKLYATNVFFKATDVDFRIDFINEKVPLGPQLTAFVSEGLAILTPEAAKILLERLQEELRRYERTKGRIAISPERGRVAREMASAKPPSE